MNRYFKCDSEESSCLYLIFDGFHEIDIYPTKEYLFPLPDYDSKLNWVLHYPKLYIEISAEEAYSIKPSPYVEPDLKLSNWNWTIDD